MFSLLVSLALGAFAASGALASNAGSQKAQLIACADNFRRTYDYIKANSNEALETNYLKMLQNPQCQAELYEELLKYKRDNPVACYFYDMDNTICYKWRDVGYQPPDFSNTWTCDAVLIMLLQTQRMLTRQEAEFKARLPMSMRHWDNLNAPVSQENAIRYEDPNPPKDPYANLVDGDYFKTYETPSFVKIK